MTTPLRVIYRDRGLPPPICIALVNDYDVVVVGLAHLFDAYRHRIVVAELTANKSVVDDVDIVLYDSFAQPEADHDEIEVLIGHPRARKVVVYTWNFHDELIESALRKGASGYLSKTLAAKELVEALEAVHAGETVVSAPPKKAGSSDDLDWPGRADGLTDRESEVLALITQGKSNAEIARLMFLSINSIKSYIRSCYRKINVDSRSRAVLWGVDHGMQLDRVRVLDPDIPGAR